ncbi:hypothetical protein INR49_031252 [Caranx melampygus]|nr:hypothetical protein INR49_031252 [Caranx melampygus]
MCRNVTICDVFSNTDFIIDHRVVFCMTVPMPFYLCLFLSYPQVLLLTLMQTLYMTTIRYVLEVWCSLGSLCSFPSSCWQATRLPTVAKPSQEDLLKTTEVCRTNEEPREGLPSPHC